MQVKNNQKSTVYIGISYKPYLLPGETVEIRETDEDADRLINSMDLELLEILLDDDELGDEDEAVVEEPVEAPKPKGNRAKQNSGDKSTSAVRSTSPIQTGEN